MNENQSLNDDYQQKIVLPLPRLKATIKLEDETIFSNVNLKFPIYDTSKDDLSEKIKGHILVFGEINYFESLIK